MSGQLPTHKVSDMAISIHNFPRQITVGNQKQSSLLAFLFMLVACITPMQASASEATQCANAKNDSDPDTCELWVNGNLNHSKASYFEGEAIPYRVAIDAVIGHEYEITIGWDAVVSDENALDFLTTYDRDVTSADPCSGDSLCTLATPSSIAAIPSDMRMQRGRDDIGGNDDDITQVPGEFTVWGGTIAMVGGYNYPADFSYTGAHEITLTLRIVANADSVVLAWGGHMASRLDWGNANGVVNLNGSPYHMRASGNEYDGDGYVGSISGIQGDLVLSTSAVVFPSYLNITKETDRSSTDSFAFMTDGAAEGVVDGAFNLQNGQLIRLTVEGNSSVYVAEDLSQVLDIYDAPLWELDNVVCTDNENMPVPFDRSGGRIDLAVGEALLIDCYFTNNFVGLPKLELVKKVILASDTCDTVDFDGTANESLDIASGDSVRYCYRVQNAGNDIAYDLGLGDDAGTVALGDDFNPPLSGGDLAALGKDGAIADLGVAGNTFSEAAIQINLPVGESVTNTATANAIDFVDMLVSDVDTATVNVAWSQGCRLDGGVSKTGDCADAAPVINVIEGTALTWCADVCMDDGNSDLLDASIALNDAGGTLQSISNQTLAAGACNTWSFGETAGSSSHVRNLPASGVDAYGNTVGCSDNATANVYDPNIALDKKISFDNRCGNGDDVDFTELYYGEEAYYCFSVTNLGDEDLEYVRLTDSLLGLDVYVGDLAAGGGPWTSSAYGPYLVTDDIHNTASVSAGGALTHAPVQHTDSADINMMFADIKVEKTGTAKLNAKENETAVSYTIKVTNIGNVTAIGVMLTDTLPELITYLSDDAGCTYDNVQHSISCDLGDIDTGNANAVTITITAELLQPAPIFGTFENLACADVKGVTTPDIDMSNNCDTHKTRIVPGATRTIGFWQNHPDHLGQCLTLDENTLELERAGEDVCGNGYMDTVNGIDLGYVQIATEACDDELDARVSTELTGNGKGHAKSLVDPVSSADIDSDVETALELGLGVLKATPSHWKDGTKRSRLDAVRTTAGRQVLAAICNATLLDALRPDFLDTYIDVLLGDDIDAILALSGDSDLYNNSGNDEPIGIPGSADPFANNDDPSDPSD
jgi:uncharacterized repeat protein (TIGR01451 family)